MRWYKGLSFILISLLIIQPIYAKGPPSAKDTSPILSWDDPRLGKEVAIPGPTKEEVYSDYVKSKFGVTSTEAREAGIVLPTSMGWDWDETSLYLIGNVSYGEVFVQGPGEVWTSAKKSEVDTDIKRGLLWLSDQEPRSEVFNWRKDIHTVSIPVKPTVDCPPMDPYCWIYPAMGQIEKIYEPGFYDPSKNGIYDYLNDLRTYKQTDWAFMIFNVLGDSFSGGYYAWALRPGPYFVMTYGVGGGVGGQALRDLRGNITAHETGHIFDARDEYVVSFGAEQGGCNCGNNPPANVGYDNKTVPNLMCERGCFEGDELDCLDCVWGGTCVDDSNCNEDQFCDTDGWCKHKCIMKGPHTRICNFSRAQMGWRDCDNDGTLDALEDVSDICGYPVDTDGTGWDSIDYFEKGFCGKPPGAPPDTGGCNYTTWTCNDDPGEGTWDYCINEYELAEYIVDDFPTRAERSDTCLQERINCTAYGHTYRCIDGRCDGTTPDSCSDTDEIDGDSFQPKTKGTVSGYQGGSPYGGDEYTDQCQDSRYLKEWYCAGTTPSNNPNYDCQDLGSSYICSSGRCEYQSSGGVGCPTLFVYDGKEYVKERKSRIHSEEGIDTVDEIVLKTKPVAEEGVYSLSLRETTLPEHSYIDSVKLFVDGEEVELISAMHSRYGDVTAILKESDDARTDTRVFDSIDLKFKVPELKGEVNYFLFEIEGYNPRGWGPPLKLDITHLIAVFKGILGLNRF